MSFLEYRVKGYKFLSGEGIEIGAFEHPASLGEDCKVKYVDVITREEAKALFPEVDHDTLREVDYVLDVSKDGLSIFGDSSIDFVIMNHVIEHLANPVKVLMELFRVVKTGGHVVIAIPDKQYTFDKLRPLTSFVELEYRYRDNVNETVPDDYRDMVTYVHPELLLHDEDHIYKHLESFKRRREHVNIWTSESFQVFLNKAMEICDVEATPVYQVVAKVNGFEYFGVWKKLQRV